MKREILLSTGAMTVIALIIKCIGFFKQAMIAGYYGASKETDIFFLASGLIANLLYAIDTALTTVLLPYYRKKIDSKDNMEISIFVSRILTFFLPMALIIMIIFYGIAPFVAKIVASNYDHSSLIILINYARIISPAIVFALIATIFNALLNANREYILPKIASSIISIIPILFIVILHNSIGILALVVAVPASYFFQALFMYVFSQKNNHIKLKIYKPNEELKNVSFLMFPVLIGSTIQQINQLVDKIISSSLDIGSISTLSYSGTLHDFVAVVFTGSIITVFFTELSATASEQKLKYHKSYLIRGILVLCLILAPISAIVIIYSKDIVSIIYERGVFDKNAVNMTAYVLSCYSIGFLSSGIRELTAKSFYAFGDTKTPTINGIIAIIVNVFLSIYLSKILGIGGIALATSIVSIFSMAILLILLRNKLSGLNIKSYIPTFNKIFISTIFMAIVISILKSYMYNLNSMMRFIFATCLGFSVYILSLLILKCEEAYEILNIVKQKLKLRREI